MYFSPGLQNRIFQDRPCGYDLPLGASCRCFDHAASRSRSTCTAALLQKVPSCLAHLSCPGQSCAGWIHRPHAPLHNWALCLAKPLLLIPPSSVRDKDGRLLLDGDVVLQRDIVHLHSAGVFNDSCLNSAFVCVTGGKRYMAALYENASKCVAGCYGSALSLMEGSKHLDIIETPLPKELDVVGVRRHDGSTMGPSLVYNHQMTLAFTSPNTSRPRAAVLRSLSSCTPSFMAPTTCVLQTACAPRWKFHGRSCCCAIETQGLVDCRSHIHLSRELWPIGASLSGVAARSRFVLGALTADCRLTCLSL